MTEDQEVAAALSTLTYRGSAVYLHTMAAPLYARVLAHITRRGGVWSANGKFLLLPGDAHQVVLGENDATV